MHQRFDNGDAHVRFACRILCTYVRVHMCVAVCLVHQWLYLPAIVCRPEAADCKIIQTSSTVFNDILVVNWHKNSLKTVGSVPIILQSAGVSFVLVWAHVCLYVCTDAILKA